MLLCRQLCSAAGIEELPLGASLDQGDLGWITSDTSQLPGTERVFRDETITLKCNFLKVPGQFPPCPGAKPAEVCDGSY